jgi:histidyl-tRNA synthetase
MLRSADASFLGFRNLFGAEARMMEYCADKLAELFQLWGYDRIELSIIESIDSFTERIVGSSPWPEWDKKSSFCLEINDYPFSYSDQAISGMALLVPEGTISVSRWLANQIKDGQKGVVDFLPLKIFYIVPCFRNEPIARLSTTKGRSFTQAGIEIIGVSNRYADLETMILIAEGIKTLGIPPDSIRIRIGDVRIFNTLCEKSKIAPEDVIPLKEALDAIAESRAGNDLKRLREEREKLKKILSVYSLSQELRSKWDWCISSWRDEITFKEARLVDCPEVISDLNWLSAQMRHFGICGQIDLSTIRSHEYYTGVVYEVDIQFSNRTIVEVAGGGRYNKLIGRFLGNKVEIPAVGFAYGVERLYSLFKIANNKSYADIKCWLSNNPTDFVVYASAGRFHQAVEYAKKLRGNGLRTDIYVGDNLSEENARCYAENRQAKLEVIV